MTLHLLHQITGLSHDHSQYIDQLGQASHVEVHRDLAEFLPQSPQHQIAVVQLEYLDELQATQALLSRLTQCRRVIVSSMEYHQSVEQLIQDYDLPNFEWVTPGRPRLQRALHTPNHEWLTSTQHPYFHDPRLLATRWQHRTRPDLAREHTFEVMLGLRRPHRRFCQQWVKDHVPRQHYLMSELMQANTQFDQLPMDSVFREPEMLPCTEPYKVEYMGRRMMQSTVLPIRLYERTRHSVVCESCTDVFFPTEKICKPIMAQRLFVVLACPGYLAHLRGLGFRTFGDVIDETYDQVEDNHTRWRMALEQMKSLVEVPWRELSPSLLPIVEHNLKNLRSLPTNTLLHRIKRAVQNIRG